MSGQSRFEGLERNTEYQIRVKAVDINGMEEEVRLTERTTNINTPTYTANPSIWTSGNITVTITYPSSKESGWLYEYRKDEGSWVQVSGTSEEVTFTANGTVIGRITDGINIVTGSLFEVTKIDKSGPTMGSVLLNNITSNSIKVTGSASDQESGIKGYYFSKDNGITWSIMQTTNTYTFTGLTKDTTYPIKVKVENNVNQETVSGTTNGKTTGITVPTYTASPTGYTSGNVVVIITYPSSKESGWTYQYQKDGGTWISVSGTSQEVTFTANGSVIGRITDGTNIVTASVFQVTKIDKSAPTIGSPVINSVTSNSIKVVVSATDNESGIKGYYYSKDNGATWSGMQTTNTYTYSSLQSGTTYKIVARVVNNVGQETKSGTVNGVTKAITTPTGTFSPTEWTNQDVTVTINCPTLESNWTCEYTTDGGGSWTGISGTQSLVYSANVTLTTRVRDNAGNVSGSYTAQVTNIDKVAPTANVSTTTNRTANGFTINTSGVDYESGFNRYVYWILINGEWTIVHYSTATSYTVSGLSPTVTYYVVVWVYDNAGNYTLTNQITVTPFLSTTEWAYDYTGGSQSFITPVAGTYKIELWGAQGGGSFGGMGGYTSGTINLNIGDTLYINVGGKPTSWTAYGYNGGGVANSDGRYASGGGGTDVRLNSANWDNEVGLRSRIMVAGGGGGDNIYDGLSVSGGTGGGLAGISGGRSGNDNGGNTLVLSLGGTQIAGGNAGLGSFNNGLPGSFGKGGDGVGCCTAAGGGGYYGGGGSGVANNIGGTGAGGSSYISGHTGSVAITSATNQAPKSGCTTGTTTKSCSIHYSGKEFTNTIMIDGAGYGWSNVRGSLTAMPKPSGGNYASGGGHIGNGYAKIRYLDQ